MLPKKIRTNIWDVSFDNKNRKYGTLVKLVGQNPPNDVSWAPAPPCTMPVGNRWACLLAEVAPTFLAFLLVSLSKPQKDATLKKDGPAMFCLVLYMMPLAMAKRWWQVGRKAPDPKASAARERAALRERERETTEILSQCHEVSEGLC